MLSYPFTHAAGVHEESSSRHDRRHGQLVAKWEHPPERQGIRRHSRHIALTRDRAGPF